MSPQRILVVTLDTLTARMAGPAIRVWEISHALAAEGHTVRLVTFSACERTGEGFVASHVTVDSFRADVEGSDVVIVQGFIMETFGWLRHAEQFIVVDLYDPFHLESLEVERFRPTAERHASLARALRELHVEAARGDFFICASERQRDLWMGHLAASGRVNPATYDADPSLRMLLDVVPFGCSPEPAVQTRHGIRGVVPGIAAEDPVVLWGGGVYNWFDPLTVVRAIDIARERVPNIRLFFLGMKHPNPDVPEMAMAWRTREESDQRGLTGTHVFFHEGWVQYEDRQNYLLDASIGVSAHFDHVETAYSFRTRMLDYLWAGLPMVCSEGDAFGALVAEHDLGAAVPFGDAEAMAEAFVAILGDKAAADDIRRRVRAVSADFEWPTVLRPLLAYCASPHRAVDAEIDPTVRAAMPPWARFRRDVAGVTRALRTGGVGEVAEKVKWRMSRLTG